MHAVADGETVAFQQIDDTSFTIGGNGGGSTTFGDFKIGYIQCEPGSWAWDYWMGIEGTGSILSKGYPEIVYAIGGLAVGIAGTLLITKKKRPVTVNSNEEDK